MPVVIRATLFAVLSSLLLLAASSATAIGPASFTVTKTEDTHDGACDNDCSLREAIDAANGANGPAFVDVPAGTYTLTIGGTDEDQNATGDLDTTGDIVIEGAGQTKTIIDGGHIDQTIQSRSGSLTMQDLTVQNGGTNITSAGNIYAGADTTLNRVTVTGGQAGGSAGAGGILGFAPVTIADSTVTGNQATDQGLAGGIFAKGAVTIERSTISGNTGIEAGGLLAGIYTLTDVTISGNSSDSTDSAGGLYAGEGGTGVLSNVTVSGNTGKGEDSVGGIWNLGSITASNLKILGNHGGEDGSGNAGDNGPGGLWNSADFAGTDIVIDSNTGQEGVGGIYMDFGTLSIERGLMMDNIGSGSDATVGVGGLYLAANGNASLTNMTINRNTGGNGAYGGVAVGNTDFHPSLTLISSTLTDNIGGGLDNNGVTEVRNNILAGNTPENCSGHTITFSGVNIEDADTCSMPAPNLSNTDPKLEAITYNGGVALTRALEPNSPAIDAADDCPIPNDDARGYNRPAGDRCDIGAFEAGALPNLYFGNFDCMGEINAADTVPYLKLMASLQAPAACVQPGQMMTIGGQQVQWGDLDCDGAYGGPGDVLAILEFAADVDVRQSADCPALGTPAEIAIG